MLCTLFPQFNNLILFFKNKKKSFTFITDQPFHELPSTLRVKFMRK